MAEGVVLIFITSLILNLVLLLVVFFGCAAGLTFAGYTVQKKLGFELTDEELAKADGDYNKA